MGPRYLKVLPASALAIAAAAALGVGLGFALSSATLLVGATITFLLSRSLFRPLIKRWVGGMRPRRRVRRGSRTAGLADRLPHARFPGGAVRADALSPRTLESVLSPTLPPSARWRRCRRSWAMSWSATSQRAGCALRSPRTGSAAPCSASASLPTALLTAKVGRIIARALKATPSETQALAEGRPIDSLLRPGFPSPWRILVIAS